MPLPPSLPPHKKNTLAFCILMGLQVWKERKNSAQTQTKILKWDFGRLQFCTEGDPVQRRVSACIAQLLPLLRLLVFTVSSVQSALLSLAER